MKVKLSYDMFKDLCLAMAEQLMEYKPDEIVAVSRGGVSAAHIISRRLGLQMGYFFPGKPSLVLNNNNAKRIVFVEDLVAKGRTFTTINNYMENVNIEWVFAPVLVDAGFVNFFKYYGIQTPHWMVFPYEEFDAVVEKDWGLFRDGTSVYNNVSEGEVENDSGC